MPQIDVKLTSSADTSGVAAMHSRIQEFERGVQHAGDEWEHLGRKLERKFSLPDLGYDLMRSFGIGSAGALVEKGIEAFFGGIEEKAKKAEEHVREFTETIKRMGEAIDQVMERKKSDYIESLAPTEKIAAKKKEIAELTEQLRIQQEKLNTANDNIRKASDVSEVAHAYFFGPGKEASFSNFRMNYSQAKEEEEAFAKQQVADAVAAQQKITELQDKIREVTKGTTEDQKKFTEAAEQSRASVDKLVKLEQDIKKVREQVGPGGLSDSEAEVIIAKMRTKAGEEQLAEEEKRFSEMMARQKEKNDKFDQELKQRQDLARTYRELGDAGAKYTRQIDEINKLESQGTLSAKDAAAARAKLKAEFDDLAGKTIRQAREEIEAYDIALAKLDHNPALSDQEKAAQRVKLLNDQTDAIKRINKALGDFMAAHPGVDVGGITAAMQSFSDKGAKNAGREEPRQTLEQRDQITLREMNDPAKHYQSAGAGMAGSLIQQFGQIGTMGDQIARTFSAVGSSIRSSMANAFTSMVTTGGSARSKIIAFGNAIGLSFIQAGAQMVADWIMKHAIMATVRRVFHITDVAETTAAEATKTTVTGVGTGARILMTMKETGANLIQAGIKAMTAVASIPYVGPILAIAALGAVIAAGAKLMKGFATGGIVSGGQQPIMVNENGTEAVLNARATSMLGRAGVDALNAGQMLPQITGPAYQPALAGAGGGAGAADGGRANMHVAFVDGRNPTALEDLERDPRFEGRIVHLMQKHRSKLGVRW